MENAGLDSLVLYFKQNIDYLIGMDEGICIKQDKKRIYNIPQIKYL